MLSFTWLPPYNKIDVYWLTLSYTNCDTCDHKHNGDEPPKDYWLSNYIKLVTLSLKAYTPIEVWYAHSELDSGFGSVVSFTPLPHYPRRKNPQYPLLRRLGGGGLEVLERSNISYRWWQSSGWIKPVEVSRAFRYLLARAGRCSGLS